MTDTTPSPAPLRFALVPIEATPQMLESAGTVAGWSGSVHMADVEHSDWYEDIVAASPGNDLLQRIVKARDNLQSVRDCRGAEACDVMDAVNALADVLNELGGGQ